MGVRSMYHNLGQDVGSFSRVKKSAENLRCVLAEFNERVQDLRRAFWIGAICGFIIWIGPTLLMLWIFGVFN